MNISGEPQDNQNPRISGFLNEDGLTAGMSIPALTDQEIAERGSENDLESMLETIEDLAITCQDLLDDQTAEEIGVLIDDLGKCPGDQINIYLREKRAAIDRIHSKLINLAQTSRNKDVASLVAHFAELLKKSE